MKKPESYNRVYGVGVDFINSFMPEGELPVAKGDQTIQPFNRAMRLVRSLGGTVIFTNDRHPAVTSHFSDQPDYITSWPAHAVAGTWGADFHPDLEVERLDVILYKGTKPDEDAYSGFQARAHNGLSLEALIMPRKHDRVAVFIGGLATDYCDKATILDAQQLATHLYDDQRTLDVYAMTDAMLPVAAESGRLALEEIAAAGVNLITSEQLVRGEVIVF